MPRMINESGLSLLRNYEGYAEKAYKCPAGIWTVGYGHTMGTLQTTVCNRSQAEQWLLEDVSHASSVVERNVVVKLTDNQFSALVCFVFNVGSGNFTSSTLLKLLNRGWYEQVPAQLARWNKAGGKVLNGLTQRRAAEAQLWKKEEDVA